MKFLKDKQLRELIRLCTLKANFYADALARFEAPSKKPRSRSDRKYHTTMAKYHRDTANAFIDLTEHLKLMLRNRKIWRKVARVAGQRQRPDE